MNWLHKTFEKLSRVKSFSIIGSSVTSLIILSNFFNNIKNIYDEDIKRHNKLFGRKRIKSMSEYKKEKLFAILRIKT